MCTAVHFNCPNTHAQFLQNNLIFLLLNWPILGRTFRLHWFGQSRVNCTLCLPHIPNVRGSISFIVGDSRTQRIPVPWLRIWWKSKHGKVRRKSSTRRLHCRKCSDIGTKKNFRIVVNARPHPLNIRVSLCKSDIMASHLC